MATSLVEQLRRLAAPQTSILKDSKKRASILFDAKEAATKDRETIYDIGRSGLDELIVLNPSFVQFEQTLFNQTAKNFERSVETKYVNKLLDKTIEKFLYHLSPYFLLESSHKCLEWLIRRFHIHEFNKNELMALILPYHSTRMFVKCVQIMPLRNTQDPWHWLDGLKKPGIPLSKQILFSRVINDQFLLKFISKTILSAVKCLDSRAYSLQTIFAFYCTTIIGAINIEQEITDSHVSHIFNVVIKGFTSNITDFTAASLMITGQLVSKTQLSLDCLEAIIIKLCKITHPNNYTDAILLLILIFKTQHDVIKSLPDDALSVIASNSSFASCLGKLKSNSVNVLPLYLPVMYSSLKNIQRKTEQWTNYKSLCEDLLLEVVFSAKEAEEVIRCFLDAYIIREKAECEVITIESDNEDLNMMEENVDINKWYADMLKKLEHQYSEIFEQVVKSIMMEKPDVNQSIKKKSLKTVLGVLFTTACSDDGANIFVNLYHYNARSRSNAVKYLVKNFQKMSFSDDSKDLLKDSISERLNDESPLVVSEVLKFKTSDLIRVVGHDVLVNRLKKILQNTIQRRLSMWESTTYLALDHLTSKEMIETVQKPIAILLAVCPFFILENLPNNHLILLLDSHFVKNNTFLKDFQNLSPEIPVIRHPFFQKLEQGMELPKIKDLIEHIMDLSDFEFDVHTAYGTVLLITYSISAKHNLKELQSILKILQRMLNVFEQRLTNELFLIGKSYFPIPIVVNCIEKMYQSLEITDLMNHLYFSSEHKTFRFLLSIYELLLGGIFTKYYPHLYGEAIKKFFEFLFGNIKHRIEFFSNYFLSQKHSCSEKDEPEIIGSTQVKSIRVSNHILSQISPNDITLNLSTLIRILSGLTSSFTAVRMSTFETIRILASGKSIKSSYLALIKKLLMRKEELISDENQLSLILFRILMDEKGTAQNAVFLNDVIAYIADYTNPAVIRSAALDLLKHINSTDILRKVAPTAIKIFDKYEGESKIKNPIQLSCYESSILQMILHRYTKHTIESIEQYPESWQLITKSLKNFNLIIVDDNGHQTCLIILVIDLFTDPAIFDQLSSDQRKQFFEAIIKAATLSENPDIYSAAGKFVRKIEINADECLNQLVQMKNVRIDSTISDRNKRKSHQNSVLLIATLNTNEWKCGVTWLEYLQNKNRLTNTHLLIPCLFDILKKCHELENQSAAEYVKQLVLSIILHCCQIISPDGRAKRDLLPDKVFKIDLVVQCIRGTQNAQTQHHALQLLSHTAAMIPEQVLLNMMEIFTFMGSTVIRRDDAYTYQIISNIIKSIIPTLIQTNATKNGAEQDASVFPILKVFSGIILDVPEHRRIRLYTDLLTTLNTQQYLWQFLVTLFESHVLNFEQDRKRPYINKRLFIAVELLNKFSCTLAIETSCKLIEFLYKQRFVAVKNEKNKSDLIDITDTCLFNVNKYTDKQLRHFRYTVLEFLTQLTQPSMELSTKISMLSNDEMLSLKPYFKDIIVKSLQFLGKVIKTAEQQNTKYWKVFILHHSYDILDQFLALLSPDMLIQVVGGLLNNIPEVRRKALELLNKKLQQPDYFAGNYQKANCLALLEPLTTIAESIIDCTKLCENATLADSLALQHHALISIKLLSTILAPEYPQEFTPVLLILSSIIKKNTNVPINILGQTVLCLAEICANLRAHAISHLSKFMPPLGKLLQKQVENVNIVQLLPILAATYKIIETLPLFLSPYMINIIVSLSAIWSRLTNGGYVQKKVYVISKLEGIWAKLSTALSIRILIPMIDQSYNQIMDEQSYDAVGPLMKLLLERLSSLTMQEVAQHQNELSTFFIKALKFRCIVDNYKSSTTTIIIDAQETHIIQALIGLTLKLSESSFRPLYLKITEWALKEEASVNSEITFYRLSSKVANSLKSLFILFANDFIQNAAELLVKYTNLSDAFTSEQDCTSIITLIESILQTLHNVFVYSNQRFINSHRFDIILQPIVDQLENELVLNNDQLKSQIPQCLAQLAKSVNDDAMWKQLNYQILLKTRNNNADIRLFALETTVAVATKLGDDFLPLLPETIPFLAELMEDESSVVEKKCHLCVRDLEQVLGESLQKYF